MPFPPVDGGAQLMHFTAIGLLENNVDVKILSINPSRNFIDLRNLPDDYVKSTRFESVNVDTRIKPFRFLINFLKKESYFIERFLSIDFEKKLEAILATENFDIVQLEHLYLCKYVKAIRSFSKAKIILRPQNIEYVIWERYIMGVNNPVKRKFLNTALIRLKKFEQSVNHNVDGILALTKEDACIFNSFQGKTNIAVIPMGYDYRKLTDYDFEKQYRTTPVVYHLASMDWLPNVEAVEWFLQKVLPCMNIQNLDAKFILAGSKMPRWVYKYKSDKIDVMDAIDSPLQFQEDKSIMIVPLWSGSGLRAKIIEGLALGKTIISTTIGAQGIEYKNGRNMLIADTPAEFAQQISRCINSQTLCKEIGNNARRLSEDKYHYKQTAQKMLNAYEDLLKK